MQTNSVRELKEKLQQSKGTDEIIRKQLLDKIVEENKRDDNLCNKAINSM